MRVIVWCLCILLSFHAFAEREGEAKVGDQSPDFKYEDKDGKIHSLKEFKGKYVLIDFGRVIALLAKGRFLIWRKSKRSLKRRKSLLSGFRLIRTKMHGFSF